MLAAALRFLVLDQRPAVWPDWTAKWLELLLAPVMADVPENRSNQPKIPQPSGLLIMPYILRGSGSA